MKPPTPEGIVCPDAQTLTDLMLGKLAPDAAAPLKAHVKKCRFCNEFARSFRELSKTHNVGRGNDHAKPHRTAAKPNAEMETKALRQGIRVAAPGAVMASFALPGYAIGEEIGRGGMGVVFRARQESLNRPVAIKMILAGGLSNPSDQVRFFREGETLAKFSHPNFVQIYEMGALQLPTGPQPYLILEYVDGGSLHTWVDGKSLAARDAAALVLVLARAMDVAHQTGIVHRDLKPANILLRPDAHAASGKRSNFAGPWVTFTRGKKSQSFVPKISDFGLAKQLEQPDGLTRTGSVMGTPAYMAPEQYTASAKAVAAAVDIYALGAILYQCLTGQPPFKQEGSNDTFPIAPAKAPPPPSKLLSDLPPELDAIVLKCLEKEPERRYLSAGALADDLEAWLAGEQVSARRSKPRKTKTTNKTWYALGAATCVILLAVVTTLSIRALSGPPGPPPPKKNKEVAQGGSPKELQPKEGPPKEKEAPPPPVPPLQYLADLEPTAKRNWPFQPPEFAGKKKEGFKKKKDDEFGKEFVSEVRVGGQSYPKAIFMHPPGFGDTASLTYELPRGYSWFEAKVSLRDRPGSEAAQSENPGTMAVYGDGVLLWDAKNLRTSDDRKSCRVSIQGCKTLRLQTTCEAEPKGCHLVWIDPRLVRDR
jgi:serine/threonine protein kinase